MNEPYVVEYEIAQSGTSRASNYAWGPRKEKSLDQCNRQELHAAISCHAFCSTVWLHPLFCTFSCQQHQLNTTQRSTSCGKCAQLNCPHGPTCTLTRTLHTDALSRTQLLRSFPGSTTRFPVSHKSHSLLDPAAGSQSHILTFSPTQLIKHSLCCAAKAIPVNGVITDSKLGVFSPAER